MNPSEEHELVKSIIARLETADPAEKEQAELELRELCLHTAQPGSGAERKNLSAELAQHLGEKLEKTTKTCLLEHLELIGGKEAVPAITKALADPDNRLREQARRALQANPDPSAGGELRNALQSSDDTPWTIALLNALGYRRDEKNVALFSSYMRNPSHEIVSAAAAALGRTGGESASEALEAAGEKADAAAYREILDAWMQCAEKFIETGEREKAVRIYQKIHDANVPRFIKKSVRLKLSNLQSGTSKRK